MNADRVQYFKKRLINEKQKIEDLIKKMKENGTVNSNQEMSSELSFYDNHPSDQATQLFDKEEGIGLKLNEVSIVNKIDDSLDNIAKGTYGKCKMCGRDISEERLEFIPYAEYCSDCQREYNKKQDIKNSEHQKVYENDLIKAPSEYDIDDYEDDTDIGSIENISNDQYKKGLPD